MSRQNDNMDAFASLLGLGLLGSLIDPKAKVPDFEKFKAEAEAKRDAYREQAKNFAKTHIDTVNKENAESAKKIFDAYVSVGFNEVQAFELLKIDLQ